MSHKYLGFSAKRVFRKLRPVCLFLGAFASLHLPFFLYLTQEPPEYLFTDLNLPVLIDPAPAPLFQEAILDVSASELP